MSKLILNSAQCRNCLEVLVSNFRHEFVSCSCYRNHKDGRGIAIDGGSEYCRRVGYIENIIELSKWEEDERTG